MSRYAVTRTVGVLVAGCIVVSGAVAAADASVNQRGTERFVVPVTATRIRLQASQPGTISVRPPAAGETPFAVATMEWGLARPSVTGRSESTGGAAGSATSSDVTLSSACPLSGLGRCRVSWDIVAPAGTEIDLVSTVSEVTVRGMSGNTAVTTTVGSVSILDSSADQVSVTATVGEVRIVSRARPSALAVLSTTGDVDIRLPDDGQPYAVSTNTTVGSVDTSVATSATSSNRIDVQTTVGSVAIHY